MSVNRHECNLDTHWRDMDCADSSVLCGHLRHHDHRYPVRQAAYEACIFVPGAFWKESGLIDLKSIVSKTKEI